MATIAQQINGCPVSLRASHAPGGDSMKVNGVRIEGAAQMLHLTLINPDSRHIVAANVTVRGFTDKPRLTQTMTTQDAPDTAKTLNVSFPADSGKEISAEFLVPGLSAATFIELNSVTYADGSTWKLPAGRVCRSQIDGIMPVGNR